jgi:hypothetical protein
MISPEALLLGVRLDENHVPVTNGRMSICRRCGTYTQGPLGQHHIPSVNRLDRAEQWLDTQAPARRREAAKVLVATNG